MDAAVPLDRMNLGRQRAGIQRHWDLGCPQEFPWGTAIYSISACGPRRSAMRRVIGGQENSAPVEIYCEDHGSVKLVLLLHGWPLSRASCGEEVTDLLR